MAQIKFWVTIQFRRMCTWFLIVSALIIVLVLSSCNSKKSSIDIQQPKLVITPTNISIEEREIISAFQDAIKGREDILAFLIYDVMIDHVDIADNGMVALLWLSLSDPENDVTISTEPGLAIATKTEPTPGSASTWLITLQADPEWSIKLAELPDTLLDQETKTNYLGKSQEIPHAYQSFSGYRLPWATGEAKYLTGSIGHVYIYKTCPSTCLYAFDFADGSMWPVLAAKGGRVKYAVWQYPNGNTKHANYIVLEDNSTSPITYQVYAHLAQDSIPIELRKPGATVVQGQKIGIVDDTGASTGHHLHFHVHTNPASYWGNSVDITFDDVRINGGRPRTCAEAKLFSSLGKECQSGNQFVSKNNDKELPTGGINSPEDSAIIAAQVVKVSAWTKDDSGISSAQLMVNFDGTWQLVGKPWTQNNHEINMDLCELGVPDGNFFIALQITDKAGKSAEGLSGLKLLTKHYLCPLPLPQCEVGKNQVALFESPEYQGNCQIYNLGTYSDFNQLRKQISSLRSIQIGNGVFARIITSLNEQLFINSSNEISASNLELLNITGLIVAGKPPIPVPPQLHITSALNGSGTTFTNLDKIILQWDITDTALEYRNQITGEDGSERSLDWTKENQWELTNLSPGKYLWTVEVRNVMGTAEAKTEFVIDKADLPPVTLLHPLPGEGFSTVIHLKWSVLEGITDLSIIEIRYRANGEEWVSLQQGFPPQVEETWLYGEPGKTYEFSIRGVDLAGHAEDFHSDENTTIALENSCTPDQYDSLNNNDDVAELATPLDFRSKQVHNICHPGDVDWFVFVGEKGAIYRITVLPTGEGSAITLGIFGFDSTFPLSEANPLELNMSTKMVWAAPADGIFYIRAMPYDERLSGSEAGYSIEMEKIVQVHTPSIIVSGLLVPLLWFFVRFSRKISNKIKR